MNAFFLSLQKNSNRPYAAYIQDKAPGPFPLRNSLFWLNMESSFIPEAELELKIIYNRPSVQPPMTNTIVYTAKFQSTSGKKFDLPLIFISRFGLGRLLTVEYNLINAMQASLYL